MTLRQTKSRSKVDDILEYRKHHTLKDTGDKFRVSSEWVRQLQLKKKQKRCAQHNRLYYNKCSYCMAQSYKDMLHDMVIGEILHEAEKESLNRRRDFLSNLRRVQLIEILVNNYNYSLSVVAKLLKKHPSTINHLYYKYAK